MAAFSRVEDETPNSLHSSRGVSWMITEASLHSLCFSVPPYRHGQKPSPPIPCHISLPAASRVFLSSLTSDNSFLFICLFSLSLPSRVGLFFFKSCPPSRSKWFLPEGCRRSREAISRFWTQTQILLLTICSSIAQSCQFWLSINILIRW